MPEQSADRSCGLCTVDKTDVMSTVGVGLTDVSTCVVGVQLSNKMGAGPNDLSTSVAQSNGVD
jgi:hypothetical protein